jgi:hypothetical protein
LTTKRLDGRNADGPFSEWTTDLPEGVIGGPEALWGVIWCADPSCRRHIIVGLVYNSVMENGGFFSQEFTAAIVSAGACARRETLEAGVPVFYLDWKRNLDIMEQPDGRKFEVCFVAGAPREANYRVIRELEDTAA